MKIMTRIATAAAALALFAAPATFADDRAAHARDHGACPCACHPAEDAKAAKPEKEPVRSSTLEAPLFTDQG